MATYYVRKNGNDSYDGRTPDQAWLTLGKALGSTGITGGDTLWIGAGTYGETIGAAFTSSASTTYILGDITGANTGDAGEVIWSAFSSGDSSVVAAVANFALGSRSNIWIEHITFISASTTTAMAISANSAGTNVTILNCAFFAARTGATTGSHIYVTSAGNTTLNWDIVRCRFFGLTAVNVVPSTSSTGSHWDLNFTVRKCLVLSPGSVAFQLNPAFTSTNRPGGLDIRWNTVFASRILTTSSTASTTIACVVRNNYSVTTSAPLQATTSGQITDAGYNLFCVFGDTSRVLTNVTESLYSRLGYTGFTAPMELGQSAVFGLPYAQPFQPIAEKGFFPTGLITMHNEDTINSTDIAGVDATYGNSFVGDQGTVTSRNTTSISDSTKNWKTDQWKGWLLRPLGSNQEVKRITSNTQTQLLLSGSGSFGNFNNLPAISDRYVIYQGPKIMMGRASSGTTTTLTMSTASWFTSEWARYNCLFTGGTGAGQTAEIASNTSTVLTFSTAVTTAPDSTTTFTLLWGDAETGYGSMNGAYDLGTNADVISSPTVSGTALALSGRAEHSIKIPVSRNPTTISVSARYDSSYTGTLPQLVLITAREMGVSATVKVTMTAAADTWERLTLPTFLPQQSGYVTIKFIANSNVYYSQCFFDALEVR